MCVGGKAVFSEDDGRTAKTVGLDNVGASLEIFPMNIEHHVRPRTHQIFVAAFQRSAAKILGRQVPLLQHSAHSAIKHKNALRQQVAKRAGGFSQISHQGQLETRQQELSGLTPHSSPWAKRPLMATHLILAAFPQAAKPLALNGCFWPLNGDFRPWKAPSRHLRYGVCPAHWS